MTGKERKKNLNAQQEIHLHRLVLTQKNTITPERECVMIAKKYYSRSQGLHPRRCGSPNCDNPRKSNTLSPLFLLAMIDT
jgi:hypothetical protein